MQYHFLTEATRIRRETRRQNIDIMAVPASLLLPYSPADPFNGNRLSRLEELEFKAYHKKTTVGTAVAWFGEPLQRGSVLRIANIPRIP